MSEGVRLYTVYERPRDYPTSFVAREFIFFQGGRAMVAAEPHHVGATLDEVRASLPQGLYRLGRNVDDDPCIVEVWV